MLFTYLKNCDRPITAIGWAGIMILGFIPNFRFGLYTFGNGSLLMLPGPREVLNATSMTLDRIKADRSGPFRVVGLGVSFLGDYSAVYGIEDIRSCAPLSNGEYIKLAGKYPGMNFSKDWVLQVFDVTAAQPLSNMLNVKYLLAPPDLGRLGGLDYRVAEDGDFKVLENLEVWPRAFFTDKVAANSSTDEFIKHSWKRQTAICFNLRRRN